PLLVLLIRRPPTPTLFPYTPLFRSARLQRLHQLRRAGERLALALQALQDRLQRLRQRLALRPGPRPQRGPARPDVPQGAPVVGRSEEHTSELQSRGHLVCRPLLEKK